MKTCNCEFNKKEYVCKECINNVPFPTKYEVYAFISVIGGIVVVACWAIYEILK